MFKYMVSLILLVFFSISSIKAEVEPSADNNEELVFGCFDTTKKIVKNSCYKEEFDELYELQKEDFKGQASDETYLQESPYPVDEVTFSNEWDYDFSSVTYYGERRHRRPHYRRPYYYPPRNYYTYGSTCRAGYYTCWLPQPLIVGLRCSCSGPYGWFYGLVTNY